MRGRKFVNVVERFACCIVSELQRSCCLGWVSQRSQRGCVITEYLQKTWVVK